MAIDKHEPSKQKRTFFNMHLTATVSMSLVLFLVGLVGLLFLTARHMTTQLKENMNISLVLSDPPEQSDYQRIERYLKASPYVKSVSYISKEKALEEHIRTMGDNPQEFLGYNPLRASLEVKPNAAYANSDSIRMIESKLKVFDTIYKVVYRKDALDVVNQNIRKLSFFLLAMALLLLLVSIALFNTTIRMMIYSNRFIINTMKLVGAKSSFIRRPYMRRSMFNGLIAALLSSLYLAGVVYYAQYHFEVVLEPEQWIPLGMVSVGLILTGVALAALLSYFAVGRYLRMTTDKMYFV